MKLDTLAGGIGRGPDVAYDDAITVGDGVADFDVQIRKGLVHLRHHLAITGAVDGLAAGTVVVKEVIGHVAIDRIEIAPVHEIFKVLDDELLVALGAVALGARADVGAGSDGHHVPRGGSGLLVLKLRNCLSQPCCACASAGKQNRTGCGLA